MSAFLFVCLVGFFIIIIWFFCVCAFVVVQGFFWGRKGVLAKQLHFCNFPQKPAAWPETSLEPAGGAVSASYAAELFLRSVEGISIIES